ncbi:LysM peptidoglycan-binding domain-containing protein [Dyadobacter sandarakinus]|uniref:LysM peptidoglycan-binding domain-containing protein n=1 Tax=Dyadobacter sandarakinus TaxID=2747268 RepID=A0ABX7ICC1_9BACT|nr:LysM peptidoglycan-binding domain-containing protein [Dyadobacter sandarakinus]QRR03620.1 LysM peptidoglycan-binding domain-containing protein [Dyadobacter sandarakinus]
MARIFFTNFRFVCAACMLLTLSIGQIAAQGVPDIPSSVSFGGITVKFDRNAQNIIEEDIKSLMSNRKFWEEKLDRAILHFPIVEGILMDEEVPIDFKYLAVQESSFRPDVVSTSNAVGYWQMKPETARELNLRVDDHVDERKNISSSTHAAAWYLKKNNQQFNNWVTTLYSYYQGAGGVKKVIPANWAYAREVTLNGKTDRYVLRFFAHKIALESGIEKYKTANAFVLMESDYGKGKSFDEIARDLGIASIDLKNYNRWLNEDKVPSDREYLITIPVPVSQVASVREKLSLPPAQTAVASVYEESGFPVLKKSTKKSSDPNGPALYEINGLPGVEARAGDKPKTLAKAGDLSMPKFMRYNDMVADMPLIPGKVYYLARKNKKASTPFHTARPGDTWHSVSQQYGVRLVNLLKYNRTTSRNYPIQTGQVLFLTKKRPKKQPVEIIAPPQPSPAATAPAVASATTSEPAPVAGTAASGNIPANAAGRKKYTPVLVEKSDGTVKPGAVVPAVTPATTPAAASNAGTPTKQPTAETNDRVVIITQDNADASFKSTDEEKREVKSNAPTRVITPNDTRTTAPMSVYQRQRAAAAEKAAREAAANNDAAAPTAAPAAAAPSVAKASYHTVQSGDTYFGIAAKYNLSLKELLALNDRDSRSRLAPGQKLIVSKDAAADPVNETSASTSAAPERVVVNRPVPASTFKTPQEEREESRSTAAGEGTGYHVVQGGQTYYSVARMYGISVRELMSLNNLTDSDRLKSGQKLRVRKGSDDQAGTSEVASGSQTHTVAPGETLFRIAQTYNTNVADIKKLNNMSGNSVMVGQKLKIPQQ